MLKTEQLEGEKARFCWDARGAQIEDHAHIIEESVRVEVVALTIPLALFSLYSEKYACIVEELRSKAVTKFRNEE